MSSSRTAARFKNRFDESADFLRKLKRSALFFELVKVLADEPTGALDSRSARMLLERLEELNQIRQTTILMVTHDAFTASYCRRILFLQDGAVLTQLERGGQSRRAFFQQIIGVVTRLGGDQSDVL